VKISSHVLFIDSGKVIEQGEPEIGCSARPSSSGRGTFLTNLPAVLQLRH